MKRFVLTIAVLLAMLSTLAFAKTHIVAFGRWLPVKWFVTPERAEPIKVRPLYIDGKLREFTLGDTHEITDSSLVVRQAFRINDSLPAEEKRVPDWKWQRGGWLLIDRTRGNVTKLNLPEFDSYYSVASWYRDYVAYCGVSDDGEKLFALVVQVGHKRPLVRQALGKTNAVADPDSECPAPKWQRDPARVTFEPAGKSPLSVDVHGHPADLPVGGDKEEQ